MLGPYIKSRGTGGTKMSANADLITVETYVQQGKTIENQFLIYGLKCKTNVYFWLFEGPWEAKSGDNRDSFLAGLPPAGLAGEAASRGSETTTDNSGIGGTGDAAGVMEDSPWGFIMGVTITGRTPTSRRTRVSSRSTPDDSCQRQVTANRPVSAAHPQRQFQGPRVEQHPAPDRFIQASPPPPTEQRLSSWGSTFTPADTAGTRLADMSTPLMSIDTGNNAAANREDRNVHNGWLHNPHWSPTPVCTSGRPRRFIHDFRRPSRT